MPDGDGLGAAQRMLGRQLAEFRRAAGLTQRELAPLVSYVRSTVANTETGRQRPDRRFWLRCDEVLHAGGQLVSAFDRLVALQSEHRARTLEEDLGRHRDVSAEVGALGDSGLVAGFSRRSVLNALSGSMFVVAGPTMARPTMAESTVVESAGADAAASGPWMSSLGIGRGVDPGLVAHFAALRGLLVASDNQVGAAAVLPTAHQQLAHIARFRRAASGRLHRDLLAAQARWAEFVGWLSDDLDDHIAGAYWLGQALTMAQEAQDDEFTMYVFARMAQRAAHGRDSDRVLGLASAAQRIAAHSAAAHRTAGHRRAAVSPLVGAFAALQSAHGYASTGQATAFQRAVEDAHTLAAQPGPAGREVDHDAGVDVSGGVSGELGRGDGLGSFCTTAYIHAQEGDGWLRLGHPHTALDRFDRALAAWPTGYRRDRGLYLARTAAAHAAIDDPEQAATTATQALHLARATRSRRVRNEVTAVARQLATHAAIPAVANLHSELTTELAADGRNPQR